MILLRLPGTYPAQGDTRLLAGALTRRGLAEGRRVLDLCTGTGALALAAAQAGAREVVAVDLSRRVAWNARLNAALARARVDVRTGDLFAPGKGRLRETERRQTSQRMNPSSCFNLVGAAQVGKSSLTGMRLLHQLDGTVPIWPFDDARDGGSLIVEIYTSIAAREAGIAPGRSKMLGGEALDAALSKLGVEAHAALDRYTDHATDAILTAAWLRRAASDEALWRPAGLDAVRMTEGWTLGVR